MIGGQLVRGSLDVDFQMSETALAIVGRSGEGQAASASMLGGILYHDFTLDVGWGNTHTKQAKNGFGAFVGAAGDVAIVNPLAGYWRVELAFLPASTTTFKTELGFELELGEGIGLLAGYRLWTYSHEHGTTELDVSTLGWIVGMTATF